MVTIHGTCVLVGGTGVLLRGPSGAGKSDVALRLIDGGAILVADDRVELRMVDGRLMASAPAALAGLLEVRGLGIVRLPCAGPAEVGLVVDLVAAGGVERLPDAESVTLLDARLPRLALIPFEPSAAAKLRLAAAAARTHTLGQVPLVP
ncbi:aldolase [Azospirillum sp. RWY-5-1]|uniref:Aldolase n=1 Tax=Azospirillum oleiclasticum TaxID=2735135 RepID=A0ABX2TLW3_9PROT|nr:HPr kinase/phosphatase C-terminal domain-containing protein [Azospirillum oleiclasticum]NYZ17869.1 aldolase [Azospirillum oleiclasticum]NYZ25077.1 aldolase [Azospirillum oleiclasticum]